MKAAVVTEHGDEVQCQIVARIVAGQALYCALSPGEAPPPIDVSTYEDRRWWPDESDALDAWRMANE